MAVGIRIKLAGVDAAAFDKIERAVDPDSHPPAGLLFHASGPIDDGWGVIDFWESREQFDRFAQERIGPAVAAAGVAVEPDIREFPVHEHFPRKLKRAWQCRLMLAAVNEMEACSRVAFRAMRYGIERLEKRGHLAEGNAPLSDDAAAAEAPVVEVPPGP